MVINNNICLYIQRDTRGTLALASNLGIFFIFQGYMYGKLCNSLSIRIKKAPYATHWGNLLGILYISSAGSSALYRLKSISSTPLDKFFLNQYYKYVLQVQDVTLAQIKLSLHPVRRLTHHNNRDYNELTTRKTQIY